MSIFSSRRVIRWEKVKSPRGAAVLTIATALGAGLFPFAPGTIGTLVGLPIAYWTADWSVAPRIGLWLGLFVLGTWSAKNMDELMGSEDNQNIVIDEVVGLGISAWTAGTHWSTLWVCFAAFRFFDVIKPPPVRQVDRWSKFKAAQRSGQLSAWWGGFGVMADDAVAGVQALCVVWVLQHFQILP